MPTQLIALPIVPDFVREEIDGARRYFAVKERCVFCDIIHQDESLARLLKGVLMRVERALESPAYNLLFHTSPLVEEADEIYHWHVELMPKLTRTAWFEWGTGFYINPTSPEEATRVLCDVRL